MTLANHCRMRRRASNVGEEFPRQIQSSGPRYTSYPTAPVWKRRFRPADLERVHEGGERAGRPFPVHAHFPSVKVSASFARGNVVIQRTERRAALS